MSSSRKHSLAKLATAPLAKVLLVEDERLAASLIAQTLAALGYEVTAVATSGAQALREIEKTTPDVILMDIHIEGDIDGIETANSIPPGTGAPVIYLTGLSDEATLKRARGTRPYGYLLKPFTDRELHATIQMALERGKVDRALSRSEERLALALESAEMGCWELDATTGNVIHMNRADRILGSEQRVFTGAWNVLLDQVADEDRPLLDTMLRDFSPDHVAGEVEFRRPAEDGVHWIKANGRLVPGESGTRIVGVMQDVTAAREKQEALRNTTDALLVQREQLGAAFDAATKASRAKSDFLAVMSHELRTPMNAILGFGQLLDRKTFGSLNTRQHEYVGHILEAGGHLLSLIDDLLDLGKIEAAKLHVTIERVELTPLLDRVAASLSQPAAEHKIELAVEDGTPLTASADPTRLRQALINLVSNAIRYNRPGGFVRISQEARSDGRVRITVADNGIGIPLERHGDVFEPFNRLGAEHVSSEGTGIGLPISKRLVELMGGRLDFESVAGAGSKFWIDLPAHQPAANSPVWLVSEAAATPLLRDARLMALYIDEQPANFRMMRNIIEGMAGGRLLEAPSAALGFELALTMQPDLILLSFDSPNLDCAAILRQLRAEPRTAAIPIAVLSTDIGPDSAIRSLSAAIVHPLTNPPKLPELFRLIGPIARRRKVPARATVNPD